MIGVPQKSNTTLKLAQNYNIYNIKYMQIDIRKVDIRLPLKPFTNLQ